MRTCTTKRERSYYDAHSGGEAVRRQWFSREMMDRPRMISSLPRELLPVYFRGFAGIAKLKLEGVLSAPR
jgi:hypothetical protein